MSKKFNEIYKSLVCENVPRRKLKSIEVRDYEKDITKVDPWVGKKPYASDGFVVNYCLNY